MSYRKHSDVLKKQVAEEYLAGKGRNAILREYDIVDSVLGRWVRQYRDYGSFPDSRGKKATGRPKNLDIAAMNKDEYIMYLEMENQILKQLRSLNNNLQK